MSNPQRAIRLIVNADDFGVSARVNEGIVLSHRRGIVTATSLMAVGRAFDHAVDRLRALPSLDVGVHLTLVAEHPLRTGSSLAGPDGRFPASAGLLLRRYLAGGIKLADVRSEWSAQIERVLGRGVSVTHLDSHQHVHVLPGIAEVCMDLAARYGIPFVRVPCERLGMDQPPSLYGLKRLLEAASLGAFWKIARLAGVAQANHPPLQFLGFRDGGRLNLERLRRLTAELQPGGSYELMCHPGLSPEEPDIRSWGYDHEGELLALSRPSLRAELTARGIRLCRFADLTIIQPRRQRRG
ncbi:MAG: ChbG/HpnK family deacetylase [Desulfobacterales bacterium]